MKVLATNDDGISAAGLWALVKELKNIADVVVVAPDREQSASGTAVTLGKPIGVETVRPVVPKIETYSVAGTPCDCVILAFLRLAKGKIDLVVSGINEVANLGQDIFNSGTVGGTLQGYLYGSPALAISGVGERGFHLDTAAKLAALLAKKVDAGALPTNIFLNINLPNLPLAETKGIKVTRLAGRGIYANSVEEDNIYCNGSDPGMPKYYRFVRRGENKARDKKTDVWAIQQGFISVTPLHASIPCKLSVPMADRWCSDIFEELQQ